MIGFFVLIKFLRLSNAFNTNVTELDDEIIVDLEFFKIANITKTAILTSSTTTFKINEDIVQIESFIDLVKKYFHSVIIFCIILLVIFIIYLSICLLCRSMSDSESIYEQFSENRYRERGQGDLSIQQGDQSIVATSIRLLNESEYDQIAKEPRPKSKTENKFFKIFKKESQRKLINENIILDTTHL